MDEARLSTLKQYDELISSSVYSLAVYSKGKEINLIGFNRKKRSHLCLLFLSTTVTSIYGGTVYVNCSKWDFFILKLKYRGRMKKVKRYKVYSEICKVFCSDYIDFLEGTRRPGIVEEIFDEYYNLKRKKKR